MSLFKIFFVKMGSVRAVKYGDCLEENHVGSGRRCAEASCFLFSGHLDAERRQTDNSDDADSGSGRHFLRNEEVSLSIQGPQLTVFILMIQRERS